MDIQEQPSENTIDIHRPPLEAKYVSIERRHPGDTVFVVDDVPFRSSMPRPTHWSIAWSDLMMTMFVLFLSMFVYKTANQDFLNRQGLEVVGGDTSQALEMDQFNQKGPPFAPISPSLPLMTAGTIKKAESVSLRDLDVDDAFSQVTDKTRIEKEIVEVPTDRVIPQQPDQLEAAKKMSGAGETPDDREAVKPGPEDAAGIGKPDTIQEIYRLSKAALETNNLKSFASIDLIPDSAMRIILTGDLLFGTGQAVITDESRNKLEQVATSIQTTPYMINIVGHTDNVPMYSDRYPSNWELSVARASTVARFLIEEMGMNPNQFVVSGYSSYRPLVPNATSEDRSRNRRVEIIISRRLPNPVPAGQEKLN